MPAFREVRRKDRMMPLRAATALLGRGEWGVLATADAEGLPLATPLSYVVDEGFVYFHCAHEGHKTDNMKQNPRVCFCVVGHTEPVYQGNFTTNYESVVVHGTAAPVTDEAEKKRILRLLCERYLPGSMDRAEADIAKSLPATAVWRILPQYVTGKAK